MNITPIKTRIVHKGDNLEEIFSESLPTLIEESVLVVTSKIVALSENAVVEKKLGTKEEKWELVKQQSEFYTDPNDSQYQLMLTIKNQILAVNAGIDESNAEGQYVLLPEDAYASAERIWRFVRQKYNLKHLGVVITDSRTFPLKWGIIGTCLAHCGFNALNNRIGEPDLFGHEMQMTQENIAEALAISANLVMGEVAEAQPLAIIEQVPMVQFQDTPPSVEDLDLLHISLQDDAYAPILQKAAWLKGGSYKE